MTRGSVFVPLLSCVLSLFLFDCRVSPKLCQIHFETICVVSVFNVKILTLVCVFVFVSVCVATKFRTFWTLGSWHPGLMIIIYTRTTNDKNHFCRERGHSVWMGRAISSRANGLDGWHPKLVECLVGWLTDWLEVVGWWAGCRVVGRIADSNSDGPMCLGW